MKRSISTSILCFLVWSAFAQNLEIINGKDFKQPGKINPALAGVQQDFIRVLTDSDIGNSYQVMLDGKIPFKLGNYMVGWERLYTDNVQDNMFNITYGNAIKRKSDGLLKKNKKPLQFRYGATVQIHTKNLLQTGFDSTSGYNFQDINGQVRNVPRLDDLKSSLNYVNIELGGGLTYKNLFASIGVQNLLTPNVSLEEADTRKLPISGNLVVGGFLNLTDKLTVFPSVLMEHNEEYSYMKVSMDGATEKLTFAASFINETHYITQQRLSASLGYRIKKNSLLGVKYTHPFENDNLGNTIPSFNVYLNASLVKSPKLFMDNMGKQLKKFY